MIPKTRNKSVYVVTNQHEERETENEEVVHYLVSFENILLVFDTESKKLFQILPNFSMARHDGLAIHALQVTSRASLVKAMRGVFMRRQSVYGDTPL